MSSSTHKRSLNRSIATLALLALLWAQALVLGHALAHAGLPQTQASVAAVSGDTAPTWGHSSGAPHCLLLDHLLVGQAPAMAGPELAGDMPAMAAPPQAPASPSTGASWRRYNARGPPLS